MVQVQIAWSGVGKGIDVALLQIVDEDWLEVQQKFAPTRWGKLVTLEPNVRFEAVGFPEVVASPRRRDTEHVSGVINIGGLVKSQLLPINVGSATPRQSAVRSASAWAGMSGAAVMCHKLLTGVIGRDSVAFGGTRLEAVPSSAFLELDEVRAILQADNAPTALEAVEFVNLETPTPTADSPAALLRADIAVIPFRPRGELPQLIEWCRSRNWFSTRLVHAQGGQGKTRLARELAKRLEALDWCHVFLSEDAPYEELAVIARSTLPVLVVIDYAESRRDQLAQLAKALIRTESKVRVLLLARTAGAWLEELDSRSVYAGRFKHGKAQELTSLESDEAGRRSAWKEAVVALAGHLRFVEGYEATNWEDLAGQLEAPSLSSNRFSTILGTQIDALATLLQAGDPVAPGDEPMEVLLAHERRYWSKVAAATHALPVLTSRTQRRAVTCATLWGAKSEVEARNVLAHVIGLSGLSEEELSAASEWLATLYQAAGRYWSAPLPDQIAEHLVRSIMASADGVVAIKEQLPHASMAQIENALTVLSRTGLDMAPTNSVIASAATSRSIVGCAAIAVAPRSEFPDALLDLIDKIVKVASLDELLEMQRAVPRPSAILGSVGIRLTSICIERLRQDGVADVEKDRTLAELLTSLARSLQEGGRYIEAVSWGREAVQICQALISRDSTTTALADMASALNILARGLDLAGRHNEALLNAEEALRAHRSLAERGEMYSYEHAATLRNYALILGNIGKHQEAVASARKSANLFRVLAPDNPKYEWDLAAASSNLALLLNKREQTEEALTVAEDAVAQFRSLAARDPDGAKWALSIALTNLALRFAERGRIEEALALSQEVFELCRELVAIDSERYVPDLAWSLNALASRLTDAGRAGDALAPAGEAVELYRQLTQTDPEKHLPDLAWSLNALANRLTALGRAADALAPAEETVELYRQLSQTDPQAYAETLFWTIDDLTKRFAKLYRLKDAWRTLQEATQVRIDYNLDWRGKLRERS